MGQNFAVAPGTILKEYMDTRGITQKELANITNSSERHVSNLINAKTRLTEEFALKLENVFEDVKAEFWMELESAYRLYLLRNEEQEFLNLKQLSEDYNFKYIFKGLKLSLKEQALKILELLQANSFEEVENEIKNISYSFMEDGGNKKAIYLWLKLCEEEIEVQNDLQSLPRFSIDNLKKQVDNFKKLMYTQDYDVALNNIMKFSNILGIAVVVLDAIPNSKVRGATRIIDNRPVILLSKRFKRLDTFYFAFMHEIAHILHGDVSADKYEVSMIDDEELNANSFARDYFIDPDEYNKFIDKHPNQEKLEEEDIIVFSKKNKIIPDILLGYLEHDGIIKDYSKFHYLKGKIKEV